MKDKKAIFLIIGLVVLVSLVGIYFITGSNNSDAVKFKNEYESLNGTIREKDGKKIRSISISRNNPMIYLSAEELVKKIDNNETMLVYFGFQDCPWCRSVVPNLIKAANDLKLDEIYYVNVKEIRDTIELKDGKIKTTVKGSDGYYELLDQLENVLDDYIITDEEGNDISTGLKRIYAPNVVAIVKGEATQLTDGISKKQNDGYMKLSDDMNEESYNYFKCIIKCVLDSKGTCSKESKC